MKVNNLIGSWSTGVVRNRANLPQINWVVWVGPGRSERVWL